MRNIKGWNTARPTLTTTMTKPFIHIAKSEPEDPTRSAALYFANALILSDWNQIQVTVIGILFGALDQAVQIARHRGSELIQQRLFVTKAINPVFHSKIAGVSALFRTTENSINLC